MEISENKNILSTFINGFDSWIETYNEISYLLRELVDKENPVIMEEYNKVGYGLLYNLSKKLTNEFELKYKDKEWDGEFFDTVIDFINEKYKA